MTLELIGLLLACVLFALWGIWKYNKAEELAHSEALQTARATKNYYFGLKDQFDGQDANIKLLLKRMDKAEILCSDTEKEVDALQEHFSRIREQQWKLNEKAFPTVLKLETQPIELVYKNPKPSPRFKPKKVLAKVKKQLRDLR